jgi:aryl-alcohol dehydrogenase-like predicted oxidoreductase
MHATAEGTARLAARHPEYQVAGFYRAIRDWQASSLGIGTYLGAIDDGADRAYIDALLCAAEGGVNWFDTAINYRHQRSERCIGAALKQLQRDEIVVCTKAGFLTPGAQPDGLDAMEVVGGMHCMSPDYLSDQIKRSHANLGVDTIDVFYIHNPETQLGFIARDEFERRVRRAFARLEAQVARQAIRWYGMATWDGFRVKGQAYLNLERLVQIAAEEGGADHHFRFIQLPFNLAMREALVGGGQSILATAGRLGITAVASATLLQGRLLKNAPAADSIQLVRSTQGIAVALVGMGRREHVLENLAVAAVPPMPQ